MFLNAFYDALSMWDSLSPSAGQYLEFIQQETPKVEWAGLRFIAIWRFLSAGSEVWEGTMLRKTLILKSKALFKG